MLLVQQFFKAYFVNVRNEDEAKMKHFSSVHYSPIQFLLTVHFLSYYSFV